MTAELDWFHNISDIPEAGVKTARHASPAALAELGKTLGLVSCDRLDARYELRRLSHGRYLLEGTIDADVTQTCVVSLEPVEAHVVEPFEVEFRPGPATAGVAEFDALETRDIEPLEGGTIPVGRIVYELLASAINPYPRKEGIEFEQTSPQDKDSSADASPFAVLRQLKPEK